MQRLTRLLPLLLAPLLLADLQAVASTGELRLKPQPGAAWPLRLALRAAPGHFEVLEVSGAQRVVFPVGSGRTDLPVTLTVAPSVYQGATPELLLRWGTAAGF